MKFQLTGTGAADGIPGFFGDDRVSRYAKEHQGKEIRLRAAAVVDDKIRIDFGPDTFSQIALYALNPRKWEAIVFTHSHDDHFAPKELQYFFPPFVDEHLNRPTVYGNQAIIDGIENAFEYAHVVKKKLLKSFETVNVSDFEITPVRAYHKLDEDSLNLIFRKGEKTAFYAADTGVWQEETWNFVKEFQFDLLIIESTEGFSPGDYWGHLSCQEVVSVVSRLRSMGCLLQTSKVVTTHHSHAGEATHEELCQFFRPYQIEPGYDGQIIEI